MQKEKKTRKTEPLKVRIVSWEEAIQRGYRLRAKDRKLNSKITYDR